MHSQMFIERMTYQTIAWRWFRRVDPNEELSFYHIFAMAEAYIEKIEHPKKAHEGWVS